MLSNTTYCQNFYCQNYISDFRFQWVFIFSTIFQQGKAIDLLKFFPEEFLTQLSSACGLNYGQIKMKLKKWNSLSCGRQLHKINELQLARTINWMEAKINVRKIRKDDTSLSVVDVCSCVLCDAQGRVPTASGNQGKLKGIFPVREKSGNLVFFSKIREFWWHNIFYILIAQIYFHQWVYRLDFQPTF